MIYLSNIKVLRENIGFTQAELSALSGISLSSLQNIECGKANPTFETLSAIFSVLGHELVLKPLTVDLSELAMLGIPFGEHQISGNLPQISTIGATVAKICQCLQLEPNERMREALEAWLLAVKSEFPRFFKKHLSRRLILDLLPRVITGRHIKLKRIATENIAKYL